MSDLKPIGIPVMIDGVERHFLFTLNAVDSLQEALNVTIDEAIDQLTNPLKSTGILKSIVKVLLDDEIERKTYRGEAHDLKTYTEKELGWIITAGNSVEIAIAVMQAYGYSLPEPEDDDPNQESGTTEE